MARVRITVLSDDGKEVHRAEYDQADPQHCIERLGDGDGWKWAQSHFGKRAQERALTEIGWGFVLAARAAEAEFDCGNCGGNVRRQDGQLICDACHVGWEVLPSGAREPYFPVGFVGEPR
jgi:hypothetical protein